MIARSIPSRAIVMRFARMPGSLSVVGWGDAAVAADPGAAVGSDDGAQGCWKRGPPLLGSPMDGGGGGGLRGGWTDARRTAPKQVGDARRGEDDHAEPGDQDERT
jgi:hypothetical protein